MTILIHRSILFFGIISITTGCQSARLMTGSEPEARRDRTETEVLLHDSQGPQATRVTMTATEAAAFRRQ